MSQNQQYRLAEDVSLTDVDDEVVLLDLSSGSYFGLNTIGATILRDIIAGVELDDSKKLLSEHYNQPLTQIANDVDELVLQLIQKNLLVRTGPPK